MIKLFEILYNDTPVAFIKEKFDNQRKCQRYTFDNLPEMSFSIPTPVFNKFKEQIRVDNCDKTIKSAIKKMTKDLNKSDLTLVSIKRVLKNYVDVNNNSNPIFRLKPFEE